MDHRSVSEDMVIEPYAGVNQIQAEYVIMVMIKEYHYVYTQTILKSYHLILINIDLDKQNVFVYQTVLMLGRTLILRLLLSTHKICLFDRYEN